MLLVNTEQVSSPQNLVLGNGTFDSAAGWTLLDGANIADGTLNFNFDGSGLVRAICTATKTIVTGVFRWSLEVVDNTNLNQAITISVGGLSVGSIASGSPTGIYSGIDYTEVTTQNILVLASSNNGPKVDNFEVTQRLLSSNHVGNGGFDDGTGWSLSGGASIAAGKLTFTAGGIADTTSLIPLSAGTYMYTIDVVTGTSNPGDLGQIVIGGTSAIFDVSSAVIGLVGFIDTAAASQILRVRAIGAINFEVDNFKIQRVD